MSDRTAEISTSVKAAGAGAGEAVSRAEQCLESARNKYETAAMHGWNGVAGTMELVAQALEGVVEQVNSVEQATQASSGLLDEITDKMSSPEVMEHLASASGELEGAHGAAEGSVGLLDEAVSHCESAGQESLPVALNSLRDEVLGIIERLQGSRNDIGAEQQEAENFAQENETKDDSGK